MNSKERVRALLGREGADRVGKADAPWPETRARWHDEGMPRDVHANDYFKMDLRNNIKIIGSFQLEEKVVEETDEFQVVSDADGNVSKYWKSKSGVPMHLKYAISSREDWERLKPRLTANDRRFAFGYYGNYFHEYAKGSLAEVKAAYDANPNKDKTFVAVETLDPYEFAMAKIGDEHLLIMMLTEPDILKDMFETYVKMVIGSAEILFANGFRPDGVFLGGDIAYKNGLLFSPKLHRELIFPYLKRIIDYFKGERGLRIVYHSDGNPTEALPNLVEAGIDCIQPMEVNAGMDLRTLAKDWAGKIAFMGNISTTVMSGPKDKLAEAVRSRVEFATKNKVSYVVHSDHSVPPTVPLENMQLVVDIVDKYGKY